MCAGTHREQKRELDPLELESQVVVSRWAWVFGLGLGPLQK